MMPPTDEHLAARLEYLRKQRGWSLEDLASRTDISRASLSRIERGETSPTASVLGRLASVYEVPMAELFATVGTPANPLVAHAGQTVWRDKETGFVRRSVSPATPGFKGTVVEGYLPAGATVRYDTPPQVPLEHHLVLLEGALDIRLGGMSYSLTPGDCLRFILTEPNSYSAPGPDAARYLLTVVVP
jgi:transcriptional regulator with XRE-family HTH domain